MNFVTGDEHTQKFEPLPEQTKKIIFHRRILIFEIYLVFYHFNEIDNEIKILRILHGSRKYQDLLK
jgi:plasmid stabilization system protein ParE